MGIFFFLVFLDREQLLVNFRFLMHFLLAIFCTVNVFTYWICLLWELLHQLLAFLLIIGVTNIFIHCCKMFIEKYKERFLCWGYSLEEIFTKISECHFSILLYLGLGSSKLLVVVQGTSSLIYSWTGWMTCEF